MKRVGKMVLYGSMMTIASVFLFSWVGIGIKAILIVAIIAIPTVVVMSIPSVFSRMKKAIIENFTWIPHLQAMGNEIREKFNLIDTFHEIISKVFSRVKMTIFRIRKDMDEISKMNQFIRGSVERISLINQDTLGRGASVGAAIKEGVLVMQRIREERMKIKLDDERNGDAIGRNERIVQVMSQDHAVINKEQSSIHYRIDSVHGALNKIEDIRDRNNSTYQHIQGVMSQLSSDFYLIEKGKNDINQVAHSIEEKIDYVNTLQDEVKKILVCSNEQNALKIGR